MEAQSNVPGLPEMRRDCVDSVVWTLQGVCTSVALTHAYTLCLCVSVCTSLPMEATLQERVTPHLCALEGFSLAVNVS